MKPRTKDHPPLLTKSKARRNSVPALINKLRPTLSVIAGWMDVSVGLAQMHQQGTFQPQPQARARLVMIVRKHAKELITLAEKVEREGLPRGK